MKYAIIGLIVCIFLSTCAASQSIFKDGILEDTDQYIIMTDYVEITHKGFTGIAYVAFSNIRYQNFIMIDVKSYDDFQIAGADTVRFSIDGKMTNRVLHHLDAETNDEYVEEGYIAVLRLDELISMRDADEVMFYINNNEYEISSAGIKSIELLLERIKAYL